MLVQQKQNIKGFTLLELLVVVAIVGIISAVGYPRLDTWISKNRVIAEAEKIHSLISLVTSQVERGYYPYAMIQFEIGSPTVIKAQGVTQSTFNKKIKKLAMQKKTVACEKTDFTGWSDGGKNEWQEIEIPLGSMKPMFRGRQLRMSNFNSNSIQRITSIIQ